MARWAWSARARGWLVVVAGVGCTIPNPDYDEGRLSTTTQSDTGSGEDTRGSATTGPFDTTQADADEVGSESGLASCEDPPFGVEVVVRPTNLPEDVLCGFESSERALFELTGGQYRLHTAPECMEGEPVPVLFSPEGPILGEGMKRCVHFDLRYRPDCSFEAVTIREDDGALLFAAATNPESHIAELELELGEPVGYMCDCESAACCEGAPQPGLYTMNASISGYSVMLDQGAEDTFPLDDEMFQLAVPRVQVTDDCERPVQVGWYFRRLGAG